MQDAQHTMSNEHGNATNLHLLQAEEPTEQIAVVNKVPMVNGIPLDQIDQGYYYAESQTMQKVSIQRIKMNGVKPHYNEFLDGKRHLKTDQWKTTMEKKTSPESKNKGPKELRSKPKGKLRQSEYRKIQQRNQLFLQQFAA